MADLFFAEEGAGPPLLLIHGTGGDSDQWKPVSALLAGERRVIRYDRLAFGRSHAAPHKKPDYWKQHGEDAFLLLQSLNATPASVVGWSGGGIVALALAALHPEAVSRLVLFEPPLWAARHPTAGMLLGFLRMLFWRALGQKRRAVESFARLAVGDAVFAQLNSAEREKLSEGADAVFAEVAGGTGEELTPDGLRGLAMPAAVLAGTGTAPFLRAAAERLSSLVPAIALTSLPGTNHLLPVLDPARFVESVRPLV